MTRFVHCADLQLGKAANYLRPAAREVHRQDRADTICSIARVVKEEGAQFVVVAGDVFDSNDVDRSSVVRGALDAFAEIGVPVFLLPGNHDHLGLRSVWHKVAELAPSNVIVLDDSVPRLAAPGVEVVGAPWKSKRPLSDPAGPGLEAPPPAAGVRRVLVAHGVVDAVFPVEDRIDQRLIRLAGLEAALAEGRIHYAALGDRHSRTAVGESGRIWYSGSPEPTSWEETDPGQILVVDLGEEVEVRAVQVGTWTFEALDVVLDSADDVSALRNRLLGGERKSRRAVRITARGSLTVRDRAVLSEMIDELAESFGVLELHDVSDLHTRPERVDPDELGLSGYQRAAYEDLVAKATAGQGDEIAAEALVLLDRLCHRPGATRAA